MAFITGFKCNTFSDPIALREFVKANVTTIHAIVYDNSGQYVLFYE